MFFKCLQFFTSYYERQRQTNTFCNIWLDHKQTVLCPCGDNQSEPKATRQKSVSHLPLALKLGKDNKIQIALDKAALIGIHAYKWEYMM